MALNKMTPEEVGWLVGIFDGEGCVSIKENVQCNACMNDWRKARKAQVN